MPAGECPVVVVTQKGTLEHTNSTPTVVYAPPAQRQEEEPEGPWTVELECSYCNSSMVHQRVTTLHVRVQHQGPRTADSQTS